MSTSLQTYLFLNIKIKQNDLKKYIICAQTLLNNLRNTLFLKTQHIKSSIAQRTLVYCNTYINITNSS